MNVLRNCYLVILIPLTFSCAIKSMSSFGFPRSIPRCPTPPTRTQGMSTPRRQQPRQDDRVVWNAFHNVLADKRGSLSELRGVLGSNANVNIHDPIHHNHTPLIIASAVLNPHLVGLLLNAGGDPNKCNGAGTTPLTAVACKVNSAIADMASGERLLDAIDEHARAVAVIELLKNAGADVSAVNQDGKCAANLIDPRCPGSKGVLSMLKPKKRLPIDAS